MGVLGMYGGPPTGGQQQGQRGGELMLQAKDSLSSTVPTSNRSRSIESGVPSFPNDPMSNPALYA